MNLKKIAVLSVVAGLLGAAAEAQTFNYITGHLLLGFRTPSAPQDVVVDIGAASIYSSTTVPITISGNYFTSSQLSTAGIDMNNLFFSVFADSASDDLWITRMRSDNNTQTTPWIAGNIFAQGPTAGRIESIANGAIDNSGSTGSSSTAVLVPANFNAGGSDISYTVGIGANRNFGNTFQGIAEGNTQSGFTSGSTSLILDLYELDTARAGQAGTFLGDFELAPNGTLTFDPVTVPEPTSWATFGLGALLLGAVRKFRR